MSIRIVFPFVLGLVLALPSIAFADPPSHAPAHGYRAKHRTKREAHAPAPRRAEGGVEVVYDSERGVRVAIGIPNVFFEGGLYYRQKGDDWEVSATGADGWRIAVASKVPSTIRKAGHRSNPGPASPAGPKVGHRKGKSSRR